MNNAEQYYNKHSEEYAKKWELIDKEFNQAHYFRQKIMDAVLGMTNLRAGDKLVEIGCGSGLVLREALKKTRPVFGTDISVGMLNRVRDSVLRDKKTLILDSFSNPPTNEADALLMVNDLVNLNLPKNYFDKILSVEVLRYVENLDKALVNVAGVMKKDSVFVFTITNKWSLTFFPVKYLLRKLFGLINKEKELLQYFVTEKSLKGELKKAGLEVISLQRLGLFFTNPLTKKIIKSESIAEKVWRSDQKLAKMPIIRNLFDTFVVAVRI